MKKSYLNNYLNMFNIFTMYITLVFSNMLYLSYFKVMLFRPVSWNHSGYNPKDILMNF